MKIKSIKKHLTAIATEQVKIDSKRYEFIANSPDAWIESNLNELYKVRNALLKGNYYTRVDSVSKSGMSRTIVIKYIKDNELHCCSDLIYKLAGCDKNNRIGGCGMDMLFTAQYNLFCALCPDKDYTKDMARYKGL